jgi:hypothetical protein
VIYRRRVHHCHAHGCKLEVPPKLFMCATHWYFLRKPLRDAIWREYRPGQENDKRASLRYLIVQQRAIAEVVFRQNDERAAYVSAKYLLKSETYRRKAINEGLGDPLEGISGPCQVP